MQSGESCSLNQDNFTLENVCRLCLFSNFPMRNIFRTQVASGNEIYKVLNYLFGFEITVNDKLPPNICQPCLCKMTAFFVFKRSALHAKSELIEIVDSLQVVLPGEETVHVAVGNRESAIKENQLASNKEREAENEGINFNALQEQLAMKEEIEIVEWNTLEDSITKHDSMHEIETELTEGQSFLSTENDQLTEVVLKTERNSAEEIHGCTEELHGCPLTKGRNDEYGSHGKMETTRMSQRRNLKNDQESSSLPLSMSCSNSPEGLHKSRWNPQKRKREQDEEDMVILTESGKKLENQHQRITIEDSANYVRKTHEEVDISAKGKVMVGFELEQSQKGISRGAAEYVECHHCGEKRVTLDEMKDHIYTVHFSLFINESTGKCKTKKHTCKFCHTVLKNQSLLAKHLMIHRDKKLFKCNECDYSTIYRSNLKVHFRRHTGEKPFKCDQCEYKATQRHHLNLHFLTHTGEKPFHCDVCGYKSSTRSVLIIHLRTHTGEKPFKCNQCEYRSSNSYTLKVHLRTHTREKPFECQMCEYRAVSSSSLKRHRLRHHVRINL